jgi:hypothetical protein
MDGINDYMNRSAGEARVLMIDNYKQVQDRLFKDLDRKLIKNTFNFFCRMLYLSRYAEFGIYFFQVRG